MKVKTIIAYSLVIVFTIQLQACSNNGFHLRKTHQLPANHQKIQIQNAPEDNDFTKALKLAIEESGGSIVDKADTLINIENFREGKRVVAYDKERKARIYLLFLKFEYDILKSNAKLSLQHKMRRINLDRTFVYDANYALGKAEEEKQIRSDLYAEASRLILLRLQYSKK